LIGIDAGVKYECELDVLIFQEIAKAFQHGGFAGAHFAGEHNEPLPALDAVDEVGQRFLVLSTPIQEGGIGAQAEGAVVESKKGVVHFLVRRLVRRLARSLTVGPATAGVTPAYCRGWSGCAGFSCTSFVEDQG